MMTPMVAKSSQLIDSVDAELMASCAAGALTSAVPLCTGGMAAPSGCTSVIPDVGPTLFAACAVPADEAPRVSRKAATATTAIVIPTIRPSWGEPRVGCSLVSTPNMRYLLARNPRISRGPFPFRSFCTAFSLRCCLPPFGVFEEYPYFRRYHS